MSAAAGTFDPLALRRVRFAYLGDVALDCRVPDLNLNPAFREAVMRHIAPLRLAERMGALSEESALRGLARAYAEGVIVGSPSPSLGLLDAAGWEAWLLEHPEEFDKLRELLDDTEVWVRGGSRRAGRRRRGRA